MSKGPETTTAPALEVAWWPIDRPLPYARNARVCPKEAITTVAASIKEYGWRQPLVVDEQEVILAGHTRLLAARKLGLTHVPVHVAVGLSPAQARAFRLMDNKSNEATSWDLDLLPRELEELLSMKVDPALTGFSAEEIAALLATTTQGFCDPDEVPPVPSNPITQPGDLWLLGDHRLLCADSTVATNVERLMAGRRAALMATDPPYLVNYSGGSHPQSWGNGGKQAGHDVATRTWDAYHDHDQAVGFYAAFLEAALQHALTPDAAIYQCYAILRSEFIWQAWRQVGLLPHQVCIWKKSRAVLTHSWFLWDFEPLMVGWPEGHQPRSKPPASARAVWEIDSTIEDGASGIHPTQKPVELIRRPIEWHTRPGGLIFEPFSGSGTTIIAAEMTGRVCYAIELNPAFVDVAVARWERFTGHKAVRDVAGK